MAAETKKNDGAETETPQDIPVSTLKSDPITEHYKKVNADVNNTKEKLEKLFEKLSIEPATAEAPAVGPTPAVVANDSDSAKEDKPLSNPWTEFISGNTNRPTTATQPKSSQHLEAYFLRPHVETSKDNVAWSSKVEPLSLDEGAMQAHLNKLGPEYSIIDAICELLPEQLVLVQGRAKFRNGLLASIQYSASADIVTTMGTFKVKSVIFIIVIQSRDGDVLAGTKPMVEAPEVKPFACPSNSSQTFRPCPNTNDDLFPGASFKENDKTGSGDFRPSPFQNNRSTSPSPFSGPDKPRTNDLSYWNLQSNKDGPIERHITITAWDGYGPNAPSFEELRVLDYAAGHTGPLPLETRAKQPSKSGTLHLFSDEKPFGGQYVNPKAPSGAPTVPQSTSMAWMSIFKDSPPTQPNLSKLPKEPDSGKPASKPSSTTLFSEYGAVSNPTQEPGGNIGQQTFSSKSDL